MKRIPSDKPRFHSPTDQSYWHSCQDIAFRAEGRLELRGSKVYLVRGDGAEFIAAPGRSSEFWYETWLVLDERFPDLYRSWSGYRPKWKNTPRQA